MQKILLVRHGQASAGTHDYDRLSEKGIEQVKTLGRFWDKQGLKIDKAYAGNLKRQQQSAQYALAESNNAAINRTLEPLNEYDHLVVDHLFGEGFASANGDDLSFNDYLGIMERWQAATPQQLNGQQSWQAFELEGWNAIQSTAQQNPDAKTLAFFSSGGVIASILKQVLGLNFEQTMDCVWQIRNSSITTLGISNGRTVLIDYNTVSHLDAQLNKKLITLI